MTDALTLMGALFSPLGLWLIVTVLMGVAVQAIAIGAGTAALVRRTASLVRALRGRRTDDEEEGGEWATSSASGRQSSAP